jgi:predicted nuclease with TOPRIM domain
VLEECSDRIERIRGNMEELGESADLILQEVEEMKKRGFSISRHQVRVR